MTFALDKLKPYETRSVLDTDGIWGPVPMAHVTMSERLKYPDVRVAEQT